MHQLGQPLSDGSCCLFGTRRLAFCGVHASGRGKLASSLISDDCNMVEKVKLLGKLQPHALESCIWDPPRGVTVEILGVPDTCLL